MKVMSWNDRFTLIDHYKPADDAICSAFGINQDELNTARAMREAGTFSTSPALDVSKYGNVFASTTTTVAPTKSKPTTKPVTSKKGGATTYAKPESATKKAKVPQKRGRKGDKISRAFQAVTTTPVAVDNFIKQHGVSLAVLRQSSRFLAKMDPTVAKKIGKINVRQDKTSKQLMIWREDA